MSEILALIQSEKMFQSALDMTPSFSTQVESSLYDPRFFLPLYCQLCAPSSFVDKHLKLVESGGLALAFASLTWPPLAFSGLLWSFLILPGLSQPSPAFASLAKPDLTFPGLPRPADGAEGLVGVSRARAALRR